MVAGAVGVYPAACRLISASRVSSGMTVLLPHCSHFRYNVSGRLELPPKIRFSLPPQCWQYSLSRSCRTGRSLRVRSPHFFWSVV